MAPAALGPPWPAQRFVESRAECGEVAAAAELATVLGLAAQAQATEVQQLANRVAAMLTRLLQRLGQAHRRERCSGGAPYLSPPSSLASFHALRLTSSTPHALLSCEHEHAHAHPAGWEKPGQPVSNRSRFSCDHAILASPTARTWQGFPGGKTPAGQAPTAP